MNKRQAKKAENKAFLLQGLSYKEHKERERDYVQYLSDSNHKKKTFNGFSEDEKFLIEVGIYTEEEIKSLYYNRKNTNNRWRQKRKYKKEVLA